MVLSENCSCYLNLVFSVFFLFFRTKRKKKLGTKRVFLFSLFSLFFENIKQVPNLEPSMPLLSIFLNLKPLAILYAFPFGMVGVMLLPQ